MHAPCILLVNDNDNERDIYAAMLTHCGGEVVEARTAAEGRALAERVRPDLILLDLRLPDESGLRLAERLKGDEATRQIPIVAMSLFDPQAEEIRAAGCNAYLAKPFDPMKLIAEVGRFVALPRPLEPRAADSPPAGGMPPASSPPQS